MRFLKSSLTKKILGIVLIMGCSGVFLNGYVGVSEVQAQLGTSTTPENQQAGVINAIGDNTNSGSSIDTMGLRQILNMVLKLIYLLLRPLLVVAGLALDNTLVYASIFHLDAPLRKFRNMMKNFANFTLGFMVLFAIIKSILTNSGEGSVKDEKSPLGIIKKTLIAGVLIQASWFLLAALVDVSTIATYAVGGLPLSVLKNTTIGNQKILSVNSKIDLNKFDVLSSKGESFIISYSTTYDYNKDKKQNKTINISPCRMKETYVIGREFGDPKYRNTETFKGDSQYNGYEICVLFGNQLVMRKEDELITTVTAPKNDDTYKTSEKSYTTIMKLLANHTGWNVTSGTDRESLQNILKYAVNINSGDKAPGIVKGKEFFDGSTAMTMSDLIKKSKGFVGPLVTMYSSLLNFAQLTDTSVTSIGETSGMFLIKTGVAIALFFPLIALALVLIARIGILRLYIVASPFIVLKESFKDFIKMEKLDKYLSIKGVIGIVFAPVVTVAALSISLIFMTALVNGFKSTGSSEQIYNAFGAEKIEAIQTGNDAISFNGIAQMEFTKLPWGEAADRFSWLMINFFAIGLMRMIFFAAIKANALGEKIGGEVQKFGSNVFQTLPILPIPGQEGQRVGLGSALNVVKGAPETWIGQKESEQKRIATEFVFGKGGEGNENKLEAGQIEGILQNIKTANNPTTAGTNVTEYIKKEGITATLGEVGTANAAAFYAAINKLGATDKNKVLTNIPTEFQTQYNAVAKSEIDANVISNIKDTNTEQEVQAILNIDTNKKLLDNYFNTTTQNEYTATTVGTSGKQVTITVTRNTTGGNTYTGTAPTTPPAPTPTDKP